MLMVTGNWRDDDGDARWRAVEWSAKFGLGLVRHDGHRELSPKAHGLHFIGLQL